MTPDDLKRLRSLCEPRSTTTRRSRVTTSCPNCDGTYYRGQWRRCPGCGCEHWEERVRREAVVTSHINLYVRGGERVYHASWRGGADGNGPTPDEALRALICTLDAVAIEDGLRALHEWLGRGEVVECACRRLSDTCGEWDPACPLHQFRMPTFPQLVGQPPPGHVAAEPIERGQAVAFSSDGRLVPVAVRCACSVHGWPKLVAWKPGTADEAMMVVGTDHTADTCAKAFADGTHVRVHRSGGREVHET